MLTRKSFPSLAFCLGALLLDSTSGRLRADEPPAADAAHLEQVTAELAQADAGPSPLAPEHVQACIGGMAGGVYPCSNIDLVEFMPHTTFGTAGGTVKTNSLWGWTDPVTGHEWVLLGLNNGTAFIDITDPENPVYAGKLPSHAGIVSTWRDVREYADHAYIVVDNGGAHGMQVFDLRQLRDVAVPPVTFAETAHYAGVTNTHTISITRETGYAYLVGSNTCGTGMHIVNLANPASPQFVACYNDGGYIHENQCFVYHGPDTTYTGHEICLAARGSAHNLDIVDVTNHAVPVRLDSLHYNNAGYSHQAWFTDDHRYILLNDELDENGVTPTRTYIFDALDLDNLVLAGANGYFSHSTPAIDHNLYVRANFVFESNYTSGLRILALTDLAQAQLTEVGFFDLFPLNNDDVFDGTWNNYPFFESGNIPVSHISQGLFILRPTNLCTAPAAPSGLQASPNGDHRIDLDWTGSGAPGATFKVERALGGCSGTFETVATGLASPAFDDLTASGVVTYGYRIAERDATGICGSPASACVEASTTGTCTAPPAFVGIASATNQGTASCAVDLGWTPSTVYCGGPATYSVYRGATDSFVPSPANRIAQGLSGLSHVDTSAPSLTPSFYVVRAVDSASSNEDSNIVHLGATATGPAIDGTFATGAEPGDPPLDTLGGGSDDALANSEALAPEHAGWHLSPARKRTGTHSFYSIDANNACITLEMPLALSAAQSPELSFWTIWDIEAGFDGGIVEISTNGGATWTRLTPSPPGYPNTISNGGNACTTALANGTPAFSSMGQLGTWQQRTIDLSAYAGQSVRLAWRYGTDSGVTGEGWYVDDIAVTHTQIPSACTSNLIFLDGFVTGTTGAWSAAVP
ncbi:MAG: choice-of-anchor B family protein [Thermoanaerobaculia bacterium]|nr:choice-of-anchor B family protein [Thermoanaerobaculia bacterium]